jgi:hypothetical protein
MEGRVDECISEPVIGSGSVDELIHRLVPELKGHLFAGASKGEQILLRLKYQELLRQRAELPTFADAEFRCYSQMGDDGILWYLFSLIGTTNKKCVEICAGDGIECNTANLIINDGWVGLLFDGNEENTRRGERFYAICPETLFSPPTLVNAWITAENVNSLIRDAGFAGEIDLLSLDMDGVDYWIWRAIDVIRPRVVVVEYNISLGPELAVTVPYNPDFVWQATPGSSDFRDWYFGASLAAFAKLGREKGYRLVGSLRHGLNAYFIRSEISPDILPEITPASCFESPLIKNYKAKEVWQGWPSKPLYGQLVAV